MPDQQQRGEHPLVRDVVGNAATPPRLALLVGYAGASTVQGYDRLYLDDELRLWAEIPSAAVRRVVELPSSRAWPWGATAVWVGFADPADLESHPVLIRGEREAVLTDLEDLRAVRATAATLAQPGGAAGGRPGGGPADVNVPKPPPPPRPKKRKRKR